MVLLDAEAVVTVLTHAHMDAGDVVVTVHRIVVVTVVVTAQDVLGVLDAQAVQDVEEHVIIPVLMHVREFVLTLRNTTALHGRVCRM